MMVYNITTVSLLVYADVAEHVAGAGFWPAITKHFALAVWCAGCLIVRRRSS